MEYTIFEAIKNVFIVLAVASIVIHFILVNYRSHKKNCAPVETARAMVYYKDPEMKPVLLGRHSSYIYHVTFHTETGESITLYLNPDRFHALTENSWGMLTWQADRFWSFEKEE